MNEIELKPQQLQGSRNDDKEAIDAALKSLKALKERDFLEEQDRSRGFEWGA